MPCGTGGGGLGGPVSLSIFSKDVVTITPPSGRQVDNHQQTQGGCHTVFVLYAQTLQLTDAREL